MTQTPPAVHWYVAAHKACLSPTLVSGSGTPAPPLPPSTHCPSTPSILPLPSPAPSSHSEIATSLSPHGAQCESECVYMRLWLIEEQIAGDRSHCVPSLRPPQISDPEPPPSPPSTARDPHLLGSLYCSVLFLLYTHTRAEDNLR